MVQRDMQRSKIERAEELFGGPFESDVRLQAFVDKIMRRAWWRNGGGPDVFVKVESDPKFRSIHTNACVPREHAIYNGASREFVIDVDSQTATKQHVLHSLTHLIMGHTNKIDPEIHDARFVATYLDLIGRFYNEKIDADVKRHFKKYLIAQKVTTKVISDETKEKQRDAWYKRRIPRDERLTSLLEELEKM